MMGTRLGRFRIIDELGGGAWGKVYLAKQESLSRDVALKTLWPHHAEDETARQRFLQEAQNMARLNHPNICKVIEVGEQGGTYYFAMEYIEGEALSDVIQQEGPMSPERVAELGAQVADALGYAHSQGIVHRDIKPANIMIDQHGRPVITDFGIAKVGEGSGLTATGASIGTPEYMSPEQAKGNPVDGRSDIYSLAVVLYHMVTGQVPFRATTPVAAAMKHISDMPRGPRELRPDCPEWLGSIILRALAKEPVERFGTAQEMASALRAARPPISPTAEMPVSDAQHVSVHPPAASQQQAVAVSPVTAVPSDSTRVWAIAAVVAAIGVILLIMAVLFFMQLQTGRSGEGQVDVTNGSGGGGSVSPPPEEPKPPLPPVPREVEVPDVVGLPADKAEACLHDAGAFVVEHNPSRHSDVHPEGYIADQVPPAGTKLETGDVVYLSKSLGRKPSSDAGAGGPWFVISTCSKTPADAEKSVRKLRSLGLSQAQLLFSSNFPKLRAGYYMAVAARFSNSHDAQNYEKRVEEHGIDAYVKRAY